MGAQSRYEQRERRLDKEYQMAMNRDYKAYRELYFTSPNERKGPLMTKSQFALQYKAWFDMAQQSTDRKKTIRGHKIGEHIFEDRTSAFSEKEFSSLMSGIERARSEILSGKMDAFTGDASDVASFMGATMDERYIRSNFTVMYNMLRSLFGSREEFEAWVSPEVSAVDI